MNKYKKGDVLFFKANALDEENDELELDKIYKAYFDYHDENDNDIHIIIKNYRGEEEYLTYIKQSQILPNGKLTETLYI